MTAIPMRLEAALRFNGYTIEQADHAAFSVTVAGGVIEVPAMRLSSLTWQRGVDDPAKPSDSFYLDALPVFDDLYRPVILSHILDRYSTRRIGYDMPDQFGLAVRRWANLNLGGMSVINRRYASTAVVLPLDTQDATTTVDDKARDATSDFPQTQLSGDVDYAAFATDRVANQTRHDSGRLGRSVAELLIEQRTAYLNVDVELLELLDPLFLQVWDRSEFDSSLAPAPSALGFLPTHW